MTPPALRKPKTLLVMAGLSVGGALVVATCTLMGDDHSQDEGPPSFVVQPEPEPQPNPTPSAPAPPPPEALSVVFELGAPGGAPASDIGAQRVALADGTARWADDHLVVVSDSAYHERRPVVVGDGAGGFVAVYEAEVPEGPLKGDLDLLAQRVDAGGLTLWGSGKQSVVLASTGAVERAPALVPDGKGGVYVLFERHGLDEADALDSDLAGQHIGPDGALLWADGTQEGLPLATGPGLVSGVVAAADGVGGLIVVFELEPTGGPNPGSHELWAQRIAPYGAPQWGSDGRPIAVAAAKGSVSAAALLPDGAGGALIVFREEVVEGELAGDFDLMAQRIDTDGSLPWSGDPQAYKVVSATTLVEGPPAVISDGAGGAIVAYQATWAQGPRSGQVDLFAQRIDASGVGLWNQGAPVPIASSDWSEGQPQLVADGAGGVIAVFEQAPPAAHLSKDQDLYAQRIGPDGALLWHEGQQSAVLSATTHLERAPSVASDGMGGVVVFFEAVGQAGEHAGDSELVAQRLDANGQRQWGEDNAPVLVAFSAAMERAPAVVQP
jgi:hypothetical protein